VDNKNKLQKKKEGTLRGTDAVLKRTTPIRTSETSNPQAIPFPLANIVDINKIPKKK
jgi:hypothetical protein